MRRSPRWEPIPLGFLGAFLGAVLTVAHEVYSSLDDITASANPLFNSMAEMFVACLVGGATFAGAALVRNWIVER
jgi:hypothetical protein